MQTNGVSRPPPTARNGKPHHRYTSSSDSSYGRVASMSRSESGTSETHYDDRPATPPTKVLMDEFSQRGSTNGNSTINSSSRRRSNIRNSHDPVAVHLLVEGAIEESQHFDILTLEELEQLKKQRMALSRRIESTRRKLGLEMKVRDAARAYGKLDPNARNQQPNGVSPSTQHANYEETSRRCEQYAHELWRLEQEESDLKNKQLQHTAGVLQLNHQMQAKNTQARSHGTRGVNDWDDDSDDEFPVRGGMSNGMDGIMDIPGFGSSDRHMIEQLQGFNSAVYDIINGSGMTSSPAYPPPPPKGAGAQAEIAYLEESLSTVKELHQELLRFLQEAQERDRNSGAFSRETQEMLSGLWEVVNASETEHQQRRRDMQQDGSTSRGLEDDYSDDEDDDPNYSLQNFSLRVQRLAQRANNLSSKHAAMHSEMEQMRAGETTRADEKSQLVNQMQEAHDKHLASQRSLQDTQSQLTEAKAQLGEVNQELSFVKQQYEAQRSYESSRQQSEDTLRSDLDAKVAHINTLEQTIANHAVELESTREAHQTELTTTRDAHQTELETARSQIASAQEESERARQLEKEKTDLEADVIRLQTEVTIAKAELDGAYGSRAERAAESASKEVQAEAQRRAEMEARVENLQRELKEMVTEYEALVKQGVEAERDREALENMNDSLREKLENLEVKLSEEKVKYVGQSQSQGNDGLGLTIPGAEPSKPKDSATVKIMREEFRKIIREMKMEHHDGIKAELVERRKLEALVRTLRKEQQQTTASGASGSTLSPVSKKSGLSQSVTAS